MRNAQHHISIVANALLGLVALGLTIYGLYYALIGPQP